MTRTRTRQVVLVFSRHYCHTRWNVHCNVPHLQECSIAFKSAGVQDSQCIYLQRTTFAGVSDCLKSRQKNRSASNIKESHLQKCSIALGYKTRSDIILKEPPSKAGLFSACHFRRAIRLPSSQGSDLHLPTCPLHVRTDFSPALCSRQSLSAIQHSMLLANHDFEKVTALFKSFSHCDGVLVCLCAAVSLNAAWE